LAVSNYKRKVRKYHTIRYHFLIVYFFVGKPDILKSYPLAISGKHRFHSIPQVPPFSADYQIRLSYCALCEERA